MGVVGLVVDSSGKYRRVSRPQLVASGASRSAVNAVTGTAQDNGSVAINSIAAHRRRKLHRRVRPDWYRHRLRGRRHRHRRVHLRHRFISSSA
jgi:hypothetical protein